MSGQNPGDTHARVAAPAPSWRILRMSSEIYADYQQVRIAAVNRAKRGGIDPNAFEDLLAGLDKQERALEKHLLRAYEAAVPEPIRKWQGGAKWLGDHTFARLLGLLGDPRIAYPWHWEVDKNGKRVGKDPIPDPPYERSISQLWSYCGVGDPTRKRERNMSAERAMACGSPRIRSLLFVIADVCSTRKDSPYRAIYDDRRAVTANRVHAEQCKRCGPSGKPATAGSPWSKAHQLADAQRIVVKEILRDLWLVAGEDGAIQGSKPTNVTPLPPATSDAGENGHPRSETHTGNAALPASLEEAV